MGKHRNRLKIIEDILAVISGDSDVKKTHIMYRAYLSYNLLTRYLNDLLGASLIACDEENCYSLTEKGKKFLSKFSDYARFRESVEAQLNHVENEKAALKELCSKNEESRGKPGALKTEE